MEVRHFIFEEDIQKRVEELGEEITEADPDILVGVLNGASIFMSDLVRNIRKNVQIDYIKVSSYGSGTTSGRLRFERDITIDVDGKNVIIVEDIIDTGKSMKFLLDYFALKGAASVEVCTFLSKPSRREVDVEADYVGFSIDNLYVVGYGLDDGGSYRNLPYVGYKKELKK